MGQEQEIGNISSQIEILNGDVQHIIDKLNSSDEDLDFNIRSYIRAYASWVEGTIWMLKELLRRHEHKWYLDFPFASQLYLFEYDWRIKNSGEPVLTSKNVKTKENIKAFFYIASHIGENLDVDFKCSEWSEVIYFYELRDNLMHPKSGSSLAITKNQILRCEKGRSWLFKNFAKVAEKIIEKTNA